MPTFKRANEGPDSLAAARLCVLGGAVLFSIGGMLIKQLTLLGFSGWGITFYRSAVAAVTLLPLLRGRRLPGFRDWLIGGVLYTLLLVSFVLATQGTTAANAIFLQYTAPVYVLLFSPWITGEPRRRADVLAVSVALAGVAVLFLGSPGGGDLAGMLLGAFSGVAFGSYMLWMRRLRYADPVAVTGVNNLAVALFVVPVLALTTPGELRLLPQALAGEGAALQAGGLLLLLGTVQLALAYVLVMRGLRRIPAAEGSQITLVEPVLNPLWVWLAIGETVGPHTLVGGGLILFALLLRYTVLAERRPKAAEGRAS